MWPRIADRPLPLTDNLSAHGDHLRARELFEDVLTRRRRVLGDTHPDTLRSADRLAHTLHALGRHEEARQVEEALGRRHQD